MAVGKASSDKIPERSCKRKSYFLPGFSDFRKSVLAELCTEFLVPTAGMRKEQMVEALFDVDNAATFGYQSQWTPLDSEQLLVLCVKARVRFHRGRLGHSECDVPSFAGLGNDLTFLMHDHGCQRASSSTSTGAVQPSFTVNVAVHPQ